MKIINRIQHQQRGDTIVEVLIAIAVLGTVLAGAFAVANRSYAVGISAQERTEAVKIAESQLELLRLASEQTNSPVLADTAGELFCINPTASSLGRVTFSGPVEDTNGTVDPITYDSACEFGTSSRYKVSIEQTGAENEIYSVRVRWESVLGGVIDEVNHVYRTYDFDGSLSFIIPTVTPPVSTVTDPLVATNSIDATLVTFSSVSISGEVQNDGGSEITERGVAYGTSTNPSITTGYEPSGTGLGGFTAPITGLAPSTTYYARAYATNTSGLTGYGNEVTFTTGPAPGGLTYGTSFEGSSYFVSSTEVTISQARAAAATSGGHLVTIGSAAENSEVSNLAGGKLIWIGFNDRNNEGNRQSGTEANWVWDNGEPVTYTNWRLPNEPNDYFNGSPGEDAAVMNWAGDYSGFWNDWYDNSTDKAFYVIEYD